jgi:hypothetical protein
MMILAVINLLVIIQGTISCKHKLRGYPKKMSDIVTFYVLAFLSLSTAIFYCFSEYIIKNKATQMCAYFMIESLPPILYLLSAYAYMAQSISVLMLQCEMTRDTEERIKKRRNVRRCNYFYYSVIAFVCLLYMSFMTYECQNTDNPNYVM